MAGSTSNKLTIEAYDNAVGEGGKKIRELQVQINPNAITRNFSVKIENKEPHGGTSGSGQFRGMKDEKISFKLQYDGTGIVDEENLDIAKQIELLRLTIYDYNGSAHETNYLKLTWGDAIKEFTCKATSMTVNYKLFKANGDPLRAEVDLAFTHFVAKKVRTKKEAKESPDLTHIKTVRVGDSLPVMCKEMYKSTEFYLQIAKINNLVNPRHLKPGQKLIFPPLKK